MRAVVQRVTRSSITIDEKVKAAIGHGLLVLVAIEDSDTYEDITWLSAKICQLRICNDAEGVMNLSVKDVGGEALIVSQFTLFASTKKGNRPSYIRSSKPDVAIPLYEGFVREMEKELGKKVLTGTFGADMKVELVNDGPVTIVLDTKSKE